MNKTVKILRTERFSVCKSQLFKTSVKKLGPLARQIAGKPIEEAIVQMRFSKKKAAAEVKRHLEYARDEAIVTRGMGLGMVKAQGDREAEGEGEGEGAEAKAEAVMKPLVVEDKKGKRRTITDRSSIYVDQAWVGRGKYGREPEFRARGRVNMLRPPYTRKSFFSSSPPLPIPIHPYQLSPSTSFPLPPSSLLSNTRTRHLRDPKGGSNTHPPRRRARIETPKKKSVGCPPGSTGYGSEAVLSLVRCG